MEKKHAILSEAIFIAAIPAFAYLLTFLYESGYLGVYNLPTSFADLSIVNTFVVAGAICLTFSFLFGFVAFIYMFIGPIFEKRHPVIRVIKIYIPFYLIAALLVFLFGPLWKEWLWAVLLALGYTSLDFIFALFGVRDKTYFQRMEENLNNERKVKNIFDVLLPKITDENRPTFQSWLKLIGLVLFLILTADEGGRAQALRQTQYLVLESNPKMVVIKNFDNEAIVLPYNPNSKSIGTDFQVINLTNLQAPLKEEKTGNLTVEN